MHFTYSTGDEPLPGYTIKRGIGVGGFGEVYFAISAAGKEVAIKRVQRHLEVELRGVGHCLNLKHPNLVAIFDVRRDDHDQAWVVMEYVSGGTLHDTMQQSPQGLSKQAALRWFGDMAAAVAYLHQHGVVHRDLKPTNVFDDEGLVKIGDYGLSKFISASQRGGNTESVGTFHYMAPEIGRGEYGKEIDIYALGVILYEMLTGKLPFDGESSQEIMMKHLTDTPDLSAIEYPYRQVIEKALQKNPRDRQGSVAEMLMPLGITLNRHGLAQRTSQLFDRPQQARVQPVIEDTEIEVMEAEVLDTQWVSPEEHSYSSPAGNPSIHYPAQHRVADREPLAAAAGAWTSGINDWWHDENVTPMVRWSVVLVAGVVLLMHSAWLIPMLSLLAVAYACYYVVRSLVLTNQQQPSYAAAHAAAAAQPARHPAVAMPVAARGMSRAQRRRLLRQQMASRPRLVRVAQLSEGFLSAMVATTVLGVLANVFGARDGDPASLAIAPYAWGSLTALIGTWIMLVLGMFWERREDYGIERRLIQLGAGAVIGAIAYGLGVGLMVPMDQPLASDATAANFKHILYASDGTLALPATMLYFSVVLFSLRWWRISDPLRNKRFSVWAVALVIVVNWIANLFVPIPQPWGMLTVASMAIAVQVASPWISRQQIAQQQVHV